MPRRRSRVHSIEFRQLCAVSLRTASTLEKMAEPSVRPSFLNGVLFFAANSLYFGGTLRGARFPASDFSGITLGSTFTWSQCSKNGDGS